MKRAPRRARCAHTRIALDHTTGFDPPNKDGSITVEFYCSDCGMYGTKKIMPRDVQWDTESKR